MKKQAMTLVEIIIAMSLVVVLALIGINTLVPRMANNSDVYKFKHAFGTISEVVKELRFDVIMYPTGSFTDLTEHEYFNDTKKYGGPDKFKKLFKSNFNVYDTFDLHFDKRVPLYDYDGNRISDSKTVSCFMDNKAYVFCVPSLTPKVDKEDQANFDSLYIMTYFSKFDLNKPNTTNYENSVFIKVSNKGKIDIPAIVSNSSDIIIDCTSGKQRDAMQCQALENLTKIEFDNKN